MVPPVPLAPPAAPPLPVEPPVIDPPLPPAAASEAGLLFPPAPLPPVLMLFPPPPPTAPPDAKVPPVADDPPEAPGTPPLCVPISVEELHATSKVAMPRATPRPDIDGSRDSDFSAYIAASLGLAEQYRRPNLVCPKHEAMRGLITNTMNDPEIQTDA